jgi:uncharacterized protein YdaU (DUF1376 family)
VHYYKFNISDWHLATSHLSLEEEAVYFKLINFYYDSECPIPLETQLVIRRLRMGNYQEVFNQILHEFFIKLDDGWHHKRCDDEIFKYHAKAKVNKTVGKLGGRPKKTQLVFKNNPRETLTTNQEPITINHKPKITTPEGVSESLFKDYLEVRKAKKAKWTETALKGLKREAEKAKISLSDVMQMCCERGWAGFKAEWVKEAEIKSKELPLGTNEQIMFAYEHECGKDPKQARFNSYYEMKAYIVQQRELRTKV